MNKASFSLPKFNFPLTSKKRYLYFALVFFCIIAPARSQTNSYLGLNGGFEGAATIVNGTTNASPVATNWTKSTTTATIANETATVRSGSNALKVTSNSATLCRVFSPLMTIGASTTAWQVQYYRRANNTTNTVQNQSANYRGGVEQSNGSYSSVAAANTWEKVTYSPTTTTSATSAAANLLVQQKGTGGDMFYDDFVLYESATVDNTAPNSATAVTVGTPTTSSLTVGWTAASGGVDGGGYMVVRYATNPNADNDPNVNGIYAVGNTFTNGTGSLVGTVRYVGTGTSFVDSGLSAGVTYFYKVYTFDKAYNYATEAQQSGATLLPSITGFSPSNGCAGSSIVITGTNFNGATAVTFGGTAATSFVVNSNTQITAVVGAGTSGDVAVTVAGSTTSLAGFTNSAPYTPSISAGGSTTFCSGNNVVLTATIPASVTDLSFTTISTGVSGTDMWQSFVPTVIGTTSSIQLYINGIQTMTGTLNIYSGVGVGGTLMTSQNVNSNVSSGFFAISLPNLNLVPGNNYTFRWQGTNLGLIANNSGYGTFSRNGVIQATNRLDFITTVAPTLGSYQWYNNGTAIGGATSATYSATSSGVYTAMNIVSSCNSAASNSSTVTVNPLPSTPTITAGGSTTFCSGGSVVLTSSSGNSYLWSTGATTQSITVSASGSYTVRVTDANGCQSALSSATTVTVNPLPTTPTISAGGSTTFCSGGSVVLTSSAGNSYLWSTGATTQSITVSTAGSYTVRVTDANGCQSALSSATTVTVNALPTTPTITAGGPTTFCAGGNVVLTSSAGSSYLWSTGATTQSITVSTAGSYTVRVTNANGCQSALSSATTVTVNPLPTTPTISAGGSTTFCSGGSVVLTSSAGNSYLWSTGATTQSITVSTAGSYTVRVTDANGCQSALSNATTVTVNALPTTPTITAGGPTTFCAGGNVVLTSSAGNSYLWSTGATTQSITVSTAGSYTVRVTNANGCQSALSSATAVTVNPLPTTPTISAGGSTTFCSGGSVVLTSSVGNSYLWSTGATTQSITVSTAGSYTVRVTDANGCQSALSAATTVTVNPLPTTPTISAGGSTTFCSGGSVVLTSSAGNSYLWSTGATTQSITVSNAGSYTVRVTNANGCQSALSSATTVTVNPLPTTPTITAGGSTTFCSGGSVVLTSSVGNSYLWSTGATTQSITVSTSGSYTVRVTDANGCQSAISAATSVTVNPLPTTPTITAGGSTTFCSGGSVVLTSSVGNSYLWSTGATTQSITVLASGSYTVRVTDANGCQSAASAATTVTVNPLPTTPTITAGGPTTFCYFGNVLLTSSLASSYLWSTGETTRSISVSTAGNYTVSVTDANGCTSAPSAATTISVYPLTSAPTITASGSTTFCSGGSVVLTSSYGTSYLWSTGAISRSINVSSPGSYTVRITDDNGCTTALSAPTVITVNPLPSAPAITPGGSTTFCAGGNVVLTSSAGAGYLWSTGATTQSIAAVTAGNYTVSIFDANGCQSSSSAPITVTTNANPNPNITGNTILCQGETTVLTESSVGTQPIKGATTFLAGPSASGSVSSCDCPLGYVAVGYQGRTGALMDQMQLACKKLNPDGTLGTSVVYTCANGTSDGGSAVGPYFLPGNDIMVGISVQTAGGYFSRVTGKGQSYANILANGQNGSNPSEATTLGGSFVNGDLGSVYVPDGMVVTGMIFNNSNIFTTSISLRYTALANFQNQASFLWSNGATTSTISVNTSGTYSVAVTNSNGCTATSSQVLTIVNPVPTPTISGATSFCAGSSTTLDAGMGYSSYLWSTGETTQTISVNTAGTYSVTVTNANGCSGTSASVSTVIIPNPNPTISGAALICAGSPTTLDAGMGYSSYLWSTGETTQTISVNTAGTYTVTVTNANGCSGTSAPVSTSVFSTAAPTPVISGTTVFCAGGSTILDAGTGYNSYSWSTGATTQTITVGAAGTYTVTVTNENGCAGTSTPVVITVNPVPTPTITGVTTICSGSSTVLDAGNGYNSYSWSTGETTQTITASAAGSYTVTVANANGCTGTSAPITLKVNPNPTPTISGATSICPEGSANFCVSPSPTAQSVYALNSVQSQSADIAMYNTNFELNSLLRNFSYIGPDLGNSNIALDRNPVTGQIYLITVNAGRRLYTIDLTTNAMVDKGLVLSTTGSNQVEDFTFDNSGNMYAVFQGGIINRINYNTPGLPPTAFTVSPPLPSNGAVGLTYNFDNDQLIYATSRNPATIYGVNLSTGSRSTIGSVSTIAQAIEYVGNNRAFVSGTFATNRIFTLDLTSGTDATLLSPTNSFVSIKDLMYVPATTVSWTNGVTNLGSASCITFTPAAPTTVTVTATYASGCSSSASVTTTVNPVVVTPTFTPISPVCSGTIVSPLPTTSNNGITGTWSPVFNNAATTTYTFTPNPGQCASTTTLAVPIIEPIGNPLVYGNNEWNVYAWNSGGNFSSNSPWITNYSGYYVASGLNFNTQNQWLNSPSDAPGYQGCQVNIDYHSWSAKRQGFPSNLYRININGHDDSAELYINGALVWDHQGCCDTHANVWQGLLGANDQVEFRATEGVGGSYGQISFQVIVPTITASGSTSFCSGGSVVLTSSPTLLGGYLWSNGATTQSITVSEAGDYSVQFTGTNFTTGPSQITTVVVYPNPVVSIAGSTSICLGDSVTLTADGASNYFWEVNSSIVPLDHVSNATLAVGLRKLKTSYNGPAIRLRRSSDNAESDFGFIGNHLDTGAILSWLNGETGFCVTLYDQSGNGGDLTHYYVFQQPTIVVDGYNGRPVLRFNTDQFLFNQVQYTTSYTAIYGARQTGGTRGRVLSAANNNWLLGFWNGAKGQAYFEGWLNEDPGTPAADNNYYIYTGASDGLTSQLYENGFIQQGSDGGVAGINGVELNGWAFGNETSDVDITDVMFFGSVLSANDRTTVENSIRDYYEGPNAQSITVTPTESTTYTVSGYNANGCMSTSSINVVVNTNCSSVVNLKLNIEGYYDTTTSSMRPVKNNQDYVSPLDEVEDLTIELRDPQTYAIVATTVGTLKTDGTLHAAFNLVPSGSYYIAVKGRNMIQTWSAQPEVIGAEPLVYDFTISMVRAYGNNMKEVAPGVWAFYSGDINQDEVVDNADSDTLFLDIENSGFGVLATDLNGDGAVDNADTDAFFINVENSIYSNHP